jgi:hypothetical protein
MSRYDTGWNDTEHGINYWTNGSKWASPLQWALEMRDIAKVEKAKAMPSAQSYLDGVIAAVDAYQQSGVIHRKG